MAGFDDIKDKGLLSSRGQDLLKARQERIQNKSVQEVRILEKLAQDLQDIDKLTHNLDVEFDKKLSEITRLNQRVEELKKAAAQVERGRIHGAEKSFRQAAMTMTGSSATVSDIAAASRASSTLGPAITMAGSMSTSSLEDYIASRKSLLARQNERIRDTSSHIEGNELTFGTQVNVRNQLISQIGQASAALSAQRKLGIDTQSSYYNAFDTTNRIRSEQELGAIRSGVSSGAFGDRRQVQEQLDVVSKRLISTFEQLDAAVKSGSKETGDLAKQFNQLEKEYKRNKDILSEMQRAGVGGGGGGLTVAGGIIGNIGTIAQGIGQGSRYVGVTSELMQAQNRIGFANLANSRFQDAYSATQGDMSALRRVMSDQYGEQVRRGLLMSGREDIAKLIETAGTGAKAIGGAMDSIGSVGSVRNFLSSGIGGIASSVTGGLAKATPDALAFTQNITDYSKQITQGQTFLQSAQQMRALQDAVSQIGDFSSQAAYSGLRGMTLGTRGLGVGAVGGNYYGGTSFTGTGSLGRAGLLPTNEARMPSGVNMDAYTKAIMQIESGGRADATNPQSSAYGLYQITNDTARSAGVNPADMRLTGSAKNDVWAIAAQNRAMTRLTKANRDRLVNMRKMYPDASSMYSDEELLAGSHYAGSGGMSKFLESGMDNTVSGINKGIPAYIDKFRRTRLGTGEADASGGTGGLTNQGILGGGDRQNVLALLSNPQMIDMIARQAGLSGKDVQGLLGAGVGGLGKEFARGGGIGAINDITRAGELSRIGYMQSPEQYFQARSAMTGVGGGAQDFEEILKNAVANGMDASKNIMEMVNATASLAQRSAQSGIAAFGGAAEGLGMGIDALRRTGVSENMATGAAAAAAQASESMAGDKGANIANVIETARLRKNFGKAELWQLEAMRTASPAQIRQLRNLYRAGKTKEAEELGIKMGVGGEGGVTSLAGAESLLEASTEQVTRQTTGFGVNREMEESIQEARRSGRALSPRERAFINARAQGNAGVSGDALFGYNSPVGGPRKGTLATAPGGIVGSGEDTIRSGAVADSKVFADGVENFNKAIGGLEALGSTMMKVSEALKPDEFAKSVKDAASEFKIPTKAFGDSVKDFNTAVGDLVRAVKNITGSKSLEVQVNPNQTRK